MREHERILQPILDLQQFAEENQYHGLIEGLGVALEEYISEASSDEDAKDLALCELSNVTKNGTDDVTARRRL